MNKTNIDYLSILNKNYKDRNYYNLFFLGKDINLKGKKILDYGSGNGRLFEFLIREKKVKRNQLYGVDIKKEHLEYVRKNVGIDNLSLINLKNQKTNLNEKFDFIFCLDVIEHSKEPNLIMEELKRLLVDDGVIVLCTPNRLTRFIDKSSFSFFNPLIWFKTIKFNLLRLCGKKFLDQLMKKNIFLGSLKAF